MPKRPGLPSSSTKPGNASKPDTASKPDVGSKTSQSQGRSTRVRTARGAAVQPIGVREWLGGIRLSAFMFVMLGLVVLAVFTLLPTIGTYIEQRQRIATLQESVAIAQEKVDNLKAEKERWSDPAYITTQARERLFYRFPGEVVYLIVDDLPAAEVPKEQKPVSDTAQEASGDWMSAMLRSLVETGLTQDVVPESPTEPTPSPKPTG